MKLSEFILCAAKASLIVLALLSAAGFAGHSRKWLELASHFRAQYALCAVALLALFACARAWPYAGGALLCLLLNAVMLAPFYAARVSPRARASSGARVKLLLANVNHANTDHGAFAEYVRRENPDVLVVQEVNAEWAHSLRDLNDLLPFSHAAPEDGGSGIALYTNARPRRIKTVFLGAARRPGILASLRVGEGATLTLLTIHPRAPLRPGHFADRNEELSAAAGLAATLPRPLVLVGDLNTTPWSPHFTEILRVSRLGDAREGFGVLPSWPTFMPLGRIFMIPIDHCLVSDHVTPVSVRTGDDYGSDHLPLVVELEVPAPESARR